LYKTRALPARCALEHKRARARGRSANVADELLDRRGGDASDVSVLSGTRRRRRCLGALTPRSERAPPRA